MPIRPLRKYLRVYRWPTYPVLSFSGWHSASLSNYAAAFEPGPSSPQIGTSPWQGIAKKMEALRATLGVMRDKIANAEPVREEQRKLPSIWDEIRGQYAEARKQAQAVDREGGGNAGYRIRHRLLCSPLGA